MTTPSLYRFDRPLHAEDIDEFHVTRLLLVIEHCGTGARPTLEGRTKLAKLDFFVRYPAFLESAVSTFLAMGQDVPEFSAGPEGVEASMVRYRYGPWDHRYYDLIALMAGRGLILVRPRASGTEAYTLTEEGRRLVRILHAEPAFAPIVRRCEIVSTVFGSMTGTALKEFVYSTFQAEVGALDLNDEIAPNILETQ
jgi:hypothetical protein